MAVRFLKIPDCQCVRGEKCEYEKCVNCNSKNIVYGNWSHCCQDCKTLQDVTILPEFVKCWKCKKITNRYELTDACQHCGIDI